MTKKTPVRKTRRLMPHLHKPCRHGTRNWTTWTSQARMKRASEFIHSPEAKAR